MFDYCSRDKRKKLRPTIVNSAERRANEATAVTPNADSPQDWLSPIRLLKETRLRSVAMRRNPLDAKLSILS